MEKKIIFSTNYHIPNIQINREKPKTKYRSTFTLSETKIYEVGHTKTWNKTSHREHRKHYESDSYSPGELVSIYQHTTKLLAFSHVTFAEDMGQWPWASYPTCYLWLNVSWSTDKSRLGGKMTSIQKAQQSLTRNTEESWPQENRMRC